MREVSRTAAIRPIQSGDYDWLYALSVSGDNGLRWRYRGRTPSLTEFGNDLWAGVHSQFVVCRRSDLRPVGLVGLVNANVQACHCELFAVAEPGIGGPVIEAVLMLLERAFNEFEFNKVWIRATQRNLEQFASIERFCDHEGTLSDYEYSGGTFSALVILSLGQASWNDNAHHFQLMLAEPAAGPPRARRMDVPGLRDSVSALWPIDSLGAVELAAIIGDDTGQEIEAAALMAIVADDVDAYVDTLLAGKLFDLSVDERRLR